NYLILVLFGAFIILITTFKISGDDDIFWHLESGSYIVENKTVPSADVFGFVTSGKEWIPFEWGWDVLSYSVYSAWGFNGVSVLRTVIFLAIFFLFTRLIIKLKLNVPLSVFIFTLLIFGMMDRLIPKPQIMSYLFMSVLLYILVSYKTFNRHKTKLMYFLPLVFLVWCNMHMGVPAGIVLLTIFIISEILVYLKPEKFGEEGLLAKKELIKFVVVYIS